MRGYAAAVAAFVIWGVTTTLFLRLIPLPGPFITCFACLCGGLAVAARIGPSRWWEARLAFSADRPRALAMAAAFAACSLTFHLAVKKTLIANAVLMHTTYPIMTVLFFLPVFRKKRPGMAGIAALSFGIIGMIVLFGPQLAWRPSWTGEWLALSSAAFFAWYCLLMDGWKTSMPRDSALVPILLLASVMLLPFAFGFYPHMPPFHAGIAIVALGILCFAIPNLLFFYAVRTIPVGHATTLGYLEPVAAITTAALFLGEPFTLHAIAGGALILVSGATVVLAGKKPPAS